MAQQYALDYPGRLRGLIVYDSAPAFSSDNSSDQVAEVRRQVAAFAERWPDRPEAVAAVRTLGGSDMGDEDVHDAPSFLKYLKAILPLYFADYRKTLNELGKPPTMNISAYDPERKPYEWDARGRLGAIAEPSLLIVGTYDFICPPVWSREMHAEMPKSQLVELTASGHFSRIEQPEQFLRSILNFLAEVNPGSYSQSAFG